MKAGNNPRMLFAYIRRTFAFKNSGMIPHSLVISTILSPIIKQEVFKTIEVSRVFISIFSEDVMKGLILNSLIFIAGLGLYIIVFLFDFITGMRASRREHIISVGTAKGYVRSDKLWSSIWKLFAVIVLILNLKLFKNKKC